MSKKRTLLTVLAVVLVMAISIVGTLAYLTKETDAVTNTFIAGSGIIKDDDAANFTLTEHESAYDDATGNYKLGTGLAADGKVSYTNLAPGMTLAKDPKVKADISKDAKAYVFVKITDTTVDALEFTVADGWTETETGSGVYYYSGTGATNGVITGTDAVELDGISVLKDDQVTIQSDVTALTNTVGEEGSKTLGELSIKAYAVQAQGFASAKAAWDGADFED